MNTMVLGACAALSATAAPAQDPWPNLLSGLVGALIGGAIAFGGAWYLQHRSQVQAAKDGARAVFYELTLNRSVISASRTLGALIPQPLQRQAWDAAQFRLMGWLQGEECHHVFTAYLDVASVVAHYTVGQPLGPSDLKIFTKTIDEMSRAIEILADRAFSEDEKKRTLNELRALAAAEGYDLEEATRQSVAEKGSAAPPT